MEEAVPGTISLVLNLHSHEETHTPQSRPIQPCSSTEAQIQQRTVSGAVSMATCGDADVDAMAAVRWVEVSGEVPEGRAGWHFGGAAQWPLKFGCAWDVLV